MRLIDADVLRRELIKGHDLIGAKYVDLAPDIDAIPVIRCKDCKHRQEDTIFHKLYCDGREVVADGFCWKGERRSDGTD